MAASLKQKSSQIKNIHFLEIPVIAISVYKKKSTY